MCASTSPDESARRIVAPRERVPMNRDDRVIAHLKPIRTIHAAPSGLQIIDGLMTRSAAQGHMPPLSGSLSSESTLALSSATHLCPSAASWYEFEFQTVRSDSYGPLLLSLHLSALFKILGPIHLQWARWSYHPGHVELVKGMSFSKERERI
jgi:hypothetical protein